MSKYGFKTRVKNVIKCVIRDMSDPFYINVAPSLAYYFILSLAPIIIAVSYFANFFLVRDSVVTRTLGQILPDDLSELIIPLLSGTPTTASLVVSIIIFSFTLFLASRGMYGMIKVADYAADNLAAPTFADVPKNYVRRRLKAVVMTILMLLMIMIALVLFVFGRTIFQMAEGSLNLGKWANALEIIFQVFSVPVIMGIIIVILMIVFAWMPSKRENYLDVLPGVIVTFVGVLFASLFFIIYIKFFFIRDLFYGALTSIIIIVLWFFLVSNVIVIGIVVNRAWRLTKPGQFEDFEIMPLKKKTEEEKAVEQEEAEERKAFAEEPFEEDDMFEDDFPGIIQ